MNRLKNHGRKLKTNHLQGINFDLIVAQAWLAPARCCLVNTDGSRTVEKAFETLNEVSTLLRKKYALIY